MLAWGFGFWMWRQTLAPVPAVYRILYSNVSGLAGNLSDLTVASSQYDVLFCSETLVSYTCHVSELLVPRSVALSCCVGARCLRPVGWRHKYEMVTEHFANPNFGVVVSKCKFLGFAVWDRTFMCSLYHNTDRDERIFDYLLASMAAVQAEDVHASFLFVGDLDGHHQEWLGSTTTNYHGVAAFDFTTVSSCNQLVVGSTHARGGTLDLLMTHVHDLVCCSILGV